MQIKSCSDPEATAIAASEFIRECANAFIQQKGSFTCAISGGKTPKILFEKLAELDISWQNCHLFQVDERIAPRGDDLRNLTNIENILLNKASGSACAMHAMPVESEDLVAAAEEYSENLLSICGKPPIIDLMVLGLGTDGHTASLVPHDPILLSESIYVDLTSKFHGTKRMTLTFPVLNAARNLLWLITGENKATVLNQFFQGDTSLLASQVNRERAIVFADEPALSKNPLIAHVDDEQQTRYSL